VKKRYRKTRKRKDSTPRISLRFLDIAAAA
jgi:hypothetical protein